MAKLCADGGEDRTIGVAQKGETYTRLICDGNREVLDYVVGAKGYSENYDASVKLGSTTCGSWGPRPTWPQGSAAPRTWPRTSRPSAAAGKP